MKLVVNGDERDVTDGVTVAALIVELGIDGRRIAVECNLEIVPRAEHATTALQPGDRVEIVTMVGGG